MRSFLALVLTPALLACGGGSTPTSAPGATPSPSPTSSATAPSDGGGPPSSSPDGGSTTRPDAGAPPTAGDGGVTDAPPTHGRIDFHLLLGVAGSAPGDSLTLDGDRYTDLILSNMVAGVMYGHLIRAYTPGMQFEEDYLYGSIFGQLLQENLATEDYTPGTGLLDPSPDQQAVMAIGQGGPYQINNYAADMVYGTYEPKGYSLINYVALQKGIGYAFADAATQYTKSTPAPFNDLYFGPVLTAYFHFNDYVALQQIGPMGGYVPAWEPDYDHALQTFAGLPGNFLEVLLNAAYNQGYYGPLVGQYAKLGSTATGATVATVDSFAGVWGQSDTYRQYPYQVRYYLDQLFDRPTPTASATTTVTPDNHVRVPMATLGDVFGSVVTSLAYVDPKTGYGKVPAAVAQSAFSSALATQGVATSSAHDLSDGPSRARIFAIVDGALSNVEKAVGASFGARTATAL